MGAKLTPAESIVNPDGFFLIPEKRAANAA
jgi:hypothetical protein